ncbi:MAG: thiamine biosynthesis protein ThiS [Gammaproteobacteria bacterium]|jgi:sulfur carrier protein|nr:sulfur carrier protein ThiS [Pseudomonadales bacterium]GIT23406.1 MAG: thiamine biosynthesis protein ThiS [Gammaproteobacteria bacterium]|tara:strand:- start:895 stop:1095 length:201 start_codon:yes stop_codon:yes gene_type:complete
MELIINGDQRLIDSSYSLMDLLVSLEMTQGHIAVELNGEIIPKSTFQQQQLSDGDKIEIVQAIGGG